MATPPPYTGLVIFAVLLAAFGIAAYFYWKQEQPQQKQKTKATIAAAAAASAGPRTAGHFRRGPPCSQKTDWSMSYNRPPGCVADVESGLSRYRVYGLNKENMNQNFLAVQM